MENKWRPSRFYTQTMLKLRRIAAETDEKMCRVVDRLADQEMARLKIPIPKELKIAPKK